MTEETREQRRLYQEAGVATLDADTIARIRGAYADLDLIALFRRQLDRWGKGPWTAERERNLDDFKALLDEDERLSGEIQRLFGGDASHDRPRSGGN